jgi:aminopeptidase-like protein
MTPSSMTLSHLKDGLDAEAIGHRIYDLIKEAFPICRSITGNGVRQTLNLIGRCIPLEIHEVASGTQVFDWTVPLEWNIRDAYIENSRGEKVVDFNRSNLHVLNYSVPIRKRLRLDELKPHLFTLPDRPDWIPYRTSYYKQDWGFCLSHNQMLSLDAGPYEVVIDSSLEEGHLTYGEFYIRGQLDDEILISTHICHPSMANDNLSGVCLSALLAQSLKQTTTRYSYRFLFIPGTIGAITWLALNAHRTDKISHGLVLSGLGDAGNITYKKSRRGDAAIDRIVQYVLESSGEAHDVIDFHPYGYDERQYCSPGFNLPVGRLSRTPYGQYPEYHTSADNLDFVRPDSLGDSFLKIFEILDLAEKNQTFKNLNPMCEPQLGKRGLYDQIGADQLAMLWVLNLSDGNHTLLEISRRSGIPFESICFAADLLSRHRLLRSCEDDEGEASKKGER